jgi:hypothetical protein
MIDCELHRAHSLDTAGDALGSVIGLDPDAHHFRLYFTAIVRAHAAAWPIAQRLRTVHGAGHAGGTQHALAAHAAVEQQSLDGFLDRGDGSFKALVADGAEHAVHGEQ